MVHDTRKNGAIRVVLADDHAIFRDGLKLLLAMEPGFEVVAEVGDLGELKACVLAHQPDLLLLDYHMPGGDASAMLAYLRQRHPALKLVALTGARSGVVLKQLADARADAVLLKEGRGAELVETLRAVMLQGRTVIPPSVQALMEDAGTGLTRRELQVAKLIGDGLTNKEMADMLALSPKTVDKHRENIMRKLGVSTVAQLLRKVQALGLHEGAE